MTKLPMTPQVKAIVARIDERCARKQSFYLSTFPPLGMQVASFWDGGTKHEWTIIRSSDGRCVTLPENHPAFQPDRPYFMTALPAGHILLQTGTFCGKPATPHIYTPDTETLPFQACASDERAYGGGY
jgi:hypothetical protein